MTSQSLSDRLNALQHTISGAGIEKAVFKSTTEQCIAPKWKHLQYLIQSSNSPNISISAIANALIERSHHPSWVVVFKSLITGHRIMRGGNERLIQYMASNSTRFNLQNFADKKNGDGRLMSTYIRRYSSYLNFKFLTYQKIGIDFTRADCKIENYFSRKNSSFILKTIPLIQNLLQSVFEFRPNQHDVHNCIIEAAFQILYCDALSLYSVYNKAMIALLEVYFKLSLTQCKEALEMYKVYLNMMKSMEEFLNISNNLGNCGKSEEQPDLTQAPTSILVKLEDHLKTLESKTKPKSITEVGHLAQTMANNAQNNESSSIKAESSSMSGRNMFKSETLDTSEQLKNHIIEEERKALAALKKQNTFESSCSSSSNGARLTTTPPNSICKDDFDIPLTTDNLFSKPETTNNQRKNSDLFIDLLDFSEDKPDSLSQVLQPMDALQMFDTPIEIPLKIEKEKLITTDIDQSVTSLLDNWASNKFAGKGRKLSNTNGLINVSSKPLCSNSKQINLDEIVSLFEDNATQKNTSPFEGYLEK